MNMNDKIENNPSYLKLKKEMEAYEAAYKLLKLVPFLGDKKKLKETFIQLSDMKQKLSLLSQTPDKFNTYFSSRGWVAYESINFDFMLSLVQDAENGNIDLAEQKMISFYNSSEMFHLIKWLKPIDAFRVRYKYLKLAYEDTLAERYYAAVPILLMMIDGSVNDISKSKGFFSEKTDLTAWDSIAAHTSGLSTLRQIINDSRKKTTDEEIHLLIEMEFYMAEI